MSHSPQLLLNFAKAVRAEQRGWHARCETDCKSKYLRDYHVTTSDGARWNVTEILSSSSSVSSLPTTFLSGFVSNSFQLSLLHLWNKTCLWGKIFLLALLLVFLVSVYPSSFLFPLCLFTSFFVSIALIICECHTLKYCTGSSLNTHCHALNFTFLKLRIIHFILLSTFQSRFILQTTENCVKM